MNASLHQYQAVLLACALFMLGVWVGTHPHDSSSSSASPNLRSAGSHEEHQVGDSDGRTVPAHVSAPKSFSRAALPSPTDKEDKNETEDYVWPGGFAFKTFQALNTMDEELSFDFTESFSFSYDD